MPEHPPAYSAAFIVTGLLFEEFLKMQESLEEGVFLEAMEREVEENNYLGIKTQAARQRIKQEMVKRYAAVPASFWTFWLTCKDAEKKLALFYICLITYNLLLDFHVEVALKKWKLGQVNLDIVDVQMRLDEIASIHTEVDAWSESTQTKTTTVYIRLLNQAGLLRQGSLQKPGGISPAFWQYFAKKDKAWFQEACFMPIA